MTMLLPLALGLLVQSTVLLLLGLAAMRFARRHGPAVQSLIGRATLAGLALALLLAGPLTGHVRPVWSVGEPTPRQVAAPPETGGGGVKTVIEAPLLDGVSTGYVPPSYVPSPPARLEVQRAGDHPASSATLSAPSPPPPVSGGAATCRGVGSLWASGTALLLLWLALCQSHFTRLRRQACPIASGPAAEMLAALTTHPPALLAHPSVRSPFLAGVRRPAIFLPAAYETEFDPASLRAILAHELAHLARRDNAWTLAARLVTALLWPHPLLWALCRRLEQCGEEACDLAVLAQDCPPRAYADCLLTLAERHPLGRRERALGVGVAPFRSSLGRRIGRILDKGTHAMSTVTLRLRLTVAALSFTAALGGAFLVSSAPAQVSAAPVHTSPQTGASALVSTWLCTHDDGTGNVLIFSPNGQFEQIGPWPGESRVVGHSYGRNQAVYHSYGPYVIEGPKLRYTDTRLWVEGEKPLKADDPYVHAMDYSLSGDALTLRLEGKWVNVYHRVPAYTKAMLGIKPAASPEAVAQSQELGEARYLAGLTPVQGPGVVVTLRDSKKFLPAMPPGVAPPSIIHDSDINQIVNELKAAGAEAIAVNGQRLVTTSSVRTAGATVLINFVPTAPPFVIKAIGDPKTLMSAMNLPGGVASQIKAFDPAMFSVKESGILTLPAYSGGSEPRYAKPVLAASLDAARRLRSGELLSQTLTQKRGQLKAALVALNAQAAALTAHTQALRAQRRQAAKESPAPGARSSDSIHIQMQAIGDELAAAKANLAQKEATLAHTDPAVIAAKRQVQALQQAYREQPIRERQEFVRAVRQYNRPQMTAATLANAEDATSRQLNTIHRQKQRLQAGIAFLNAQIAQHKIPTSGR